MEDFLQRNERFSRFALKLHYLCMFILLGGVYHTTFRQPDRFYAFGCYQLLMIFWFDKDFTSPRLKLLTNQLSIGLNKKWGLLAVLSGLIASCASRRHFVYRQTLVFSHRSYVSLLSIKSTPGRLPNLKAVPPNMRFDSTPYMVVYKMWEIYKARYHQSVFLSLSSSPPSTHYRLESGSPLWKRFAFAFHSVAKSLSMLLGWFMDLNLSSTLYGAGAMISWQFILFSSLFGLVIVTKSMRRITSVREHALARLEKNRVEAPPVKYQDENEQRNASLQRVWSNSMREGGHYMRSPYYKRVKCLLISWDKEHDDLHTEPEVRPRKRRREST